MSIYVINEMSKVKFLINYYNLYGEMSKVKFLINYYNLIYIKWRFLLKLILKLIILFSVNF